MKVVVVHDYATQRGGAERVVLDLLRAFPGARLVTSAWNPESTYPEFADFPVETLWTDRVGPIRRDPRRAFPFLASAFGGHVISDADVVVCSSSGWSHRVQTDAPKIVYCHNPARWLYQPQDYFPRLAPSLRKRFVSGSKGLRRSDAIAARTAAAYLVNSRAVAARVQAAYGIDAEVVPPARGLSADGPQEPVPGIEPGYLLTVGRRRRYKHTDIICEAIARLPGERLVVVGGTPTPQHAPAGVTFCDRLSDAQLRWVYANAAGLVAMSHEDFGLTPVEAQAFGVPSVVLRGGGYLDSSVEGLTCVFVDVPTAAGVAVGVQDLRAGTWDAAAIRRHGELYSKSTFSRRVHGIVEQVLAGPGSPAPKAEAANDDGVAWPDAQFRIA